MRSIYLRAILLVLLLGIAACDNGREVAMQEDNRLVEGIALEKSVGAVIHTNQLLGESSPYLLQHAHNPVNWYPWGEEALQKAKLENKPIFLSIGYSACHWCHVMER